MNSARTCAKSEGKCIRDSDSGSRTGEVRCAFGSSVLIASLPEAKQESVLTFGMDADDTGLSPIRLFN